MCISSPNFWSSLNAGELLLRFLILHGVAQFTRTTTKLAVRRQTNNLRLPILFGRDSKCKHSSVANLEIPFPRPRGGGSLKHGAAGTRRVRAYLQGPEDRRQRDRHERRGGDGQEVSTEARGVDGELGTADRAAAVREPRRHGECHGPRADWAALLL